MGMYTGLRCKVKVKPQWHEAIDQLINKQCYWEDIQVADPFVMKVIDTWTNVGRSSMIPFGGIVYVDWDENDSDWQRSYKDGIWIFQCSLKNYEDEIGQFLKYVLPNIISESYIIESRYEEDEEETKYKFVDGAIERIYYPEMNKYDDEDLSVDSSFSSSDDMDDIFPH